LTDLSIVIVSWNTVDLTEKCLQSIYQYPPDCTFEVWVVDNASRDDSVEKIRMDFPQVCRIENQENVGFARANNQAIVQSSGRYVLLLNSDTLVFPAALQRLVDFMEAHPDAGGCGSRYFNPDGSLQTSCSPFPTVRREFWRLFHLDLIAAYGVYDMKTWNVDTNRAVDVLQGASLLLRKDALDQVGLLDDRYFMYSEEVDLCYRLRKAGWALYWIPTSIITHYGGQSTRQARQEMFVQLYRSKVQFFRKHYGIFRAGMYKGVLALAGAGRVASAWLAAGLRGRHAASYLEIVKNYSELLKRLPEM
jgi:N-acetylglucosaminyl-diphospho-decaprenol L-rhamnosyltransferase